MRLTTLLYSLMVLVLVACGKPRTLKANDYINWCNTSKELIKSKSMNGVGLWVKYMPQDYFKASNKQTGSTVHFQVELRTDDGMDLLAVSPGDQSYFQRLSYINAQIQKDFKLVVNQYDTLYCALAHLERTYGIGTDRISLEFPKDDNTPIQTITFQYDDHLFQVGRINVNYTKKDIAKIPSLKL